MSENPLDTKEKADAWLAGEVVEDVGITIDEFKNNLRNAGWTEERITEQINTISAATTRQATTAVEIDPTLVSTSGNTSAATLGIKPTPDPEPVLEPEESGLVEGDITQERVVEKISNPNYDPTDPESKEFLRIDDTNTTEVTKVIANPNYDPTDPESEELITVSGVYNIGPDGTVMTGSWTGEGTAVLSGEEGYTFEGEINPTVGAGVGNAPQLGALPQFASQAEIDQDRYDSTSAAGQALAAGQSLPKFSMATSPGTARFFGNQSEMAMPTLETIRGMTPDEQTNWNPFARMTQKPEFNTLARITADRWGGRRTAPTATMGGFGGFTQNSSIMPSRAPRPTRSTSATSQSPFGFQPQGRSGVKRAAFNRPSRLRASSIRSGRDGMIRGRGA